MYAYKPFDYCFSITATIIAVTIKLLFRIITTITAKIEYGVFGYLIMIYRKPYSIYLRGYIFTKTLIHVLEPPRWAS